MILPLILEYLNHILTIFSNIINTQNLTDAHTCYKMFSKKVFNEINSRM